MDVLKATPDLLAEYMNFLLDFFGKPGPTIEATTKPAQGAAPAVSGKLVFFALLSVGLAIVIVRLGAAFGMAEDQSHLVKVVGALDEKLLPVAALVVILALSIVAHVVFKVVSLFGVLMGYQGFKGAMASTLNVALAFGAWAIPLMIAAIVGLRIAAGHHVALSPVVFLAVIIPLTLAFWGYLVVSFAAAHDMSVGNAGALFALMVVLVSLLGKLF